MQHVPPKLCAQGYGQTTFTELWKFSFENAKQGRFYILTNSALLPGNPSLVGAQRTYTKGTGMNTLSNTTGAAGMDDFVLPPLFDHSQNRGSLFHITARLKFP